MRVDQARHGDQAVGFDSFVERPRRCPFHRTDERHPIIVDHDRALLDDITLFVHRNNQRVSNQRFHSGLKLNGRNTDGELSRDQRVAGPDRRLERFGRLECLNQRSAAQLS